MNQHISVELNQMKMSKKKTNDNDLFLEIRIKVIILRLNDCIKNPLSKREIE